MSSTDIVRPIDGNAPTISRTYIASPKLKHLPYRIPYGVRLHLPEGVLTGTGCINGTQPVVAQKHALAIVLDAIAISGRNLKTLVISRTEFLKQSLDQGRTRNIKMQYGMRVNELKTDEELFERTPVLYDMYGAGIRMANPSNDEEQHELSLIERALSDESWGHSSKFSGREEFHLNLVL